MGSVANRDEAGLRAALERYVEESLRLSDALTYLQEVEEDYLTSWSNVVSGGQVRGANAEERKAHETSLLTRERQLRDGARVRVRQCEIWQAVADRQLAVVSLLYENKNRPAEGVYRPLPSRPGAG